MKVTEQHSVTLEIDGVRKKITLKEAQALYDALGGVTGVRRHGGSHWSWTHPHWTIGTGTFVNSQGVNSCAIADETDLTASDIQVMLDNSTPVEVTPVEAATIKVGA